MPSTTGSSSRYKHHDTKRMKQNLSYVIWTSHIRKQDPTISLGCKKWNNSLPEGPQQSLLTVRTPKYFLSPEHLQKAAPFTTHAICPLNVPPWFFQFKTSLIWPGALLAALKIIWSAFPTWASSCTLVIKITDHIAKVKKESVPERQALSLLTC